MNLEQRLREYERKAQRSQDYIDISNVFALHEYYMSTPSEEMELIWAKKHTDVTFGNNSGVVVGLDNVMKFYKNISEEEKQFILDNKRKWYPDIPNDIRYAEIGDMGFHMLTTPIIEVAEDGETAKGLWYSPGFFTKFNEIKGKYEAQWMYEKYAVDFIKEDGKWKIWHFNVFRDFHCTFEENWVETSEKKKLNPDSGIPKRPEKFIPKVNKDKPGIGYQEYHIKRLQPQDLPKPPVPYRTFSETFSY